MDSVLFSGLLDLHGWSIVWVALGLTHVTIVSVTIFLHRCQTHRALELHPAVSHFFRAWLWLTTGMDTKEWVAVHRKHHAKVETVDDPHSPQILGLNRVLWGGVFLYIREAHNAETIERYGHGAPDDWIERELYSKHKVLGIVLMGAIDIAALGVVPGALVLLTQIVWIPFWAAGVINGIAHYWGYRHWATPDASTDIFPFGILIGGEELHNNHHAFPTSAKLSYRWYEFDIGWLYIRILEALRLAKVKHTPPAVVLAAPKPVADEASLRAIIRCHYDVLANYARSLAAVYSEERRKLRRAAPADASALESIRRWLDRDDKMLDEAKRARVALALRSSQALAMMYAMRKDLIALWSRSMATPAQLVAQLQAWCERAEKSGIAPLVDFSRRLRSYA